MAKEEPDDRTRVISQVPSSYPDVPQLAISKQEAQKRTPQMGSNATAATAANGKEDPASDKLLAQCDAGNHERTKIYGVCGLIAAIACFPCGLIWLFADTQYKCAKCGVTLEKN